MLELQDGFGVAVDGGDGGGHAGSEGTPSQAKGHRGRLGGVDYDLLNSTGKKNLSISVTLNKVSFTTEETNHTSELTEGDSGASAAAAGTWTTSSLFSVDLGMNEYCSTVVL